MKKSLPRRAIKYKVTYSHSTHLFVYRIKDERTGKRERELIEIAFAVQGEGEEGQGQAAGQAHIAESSAAYRTPWPT